MREDSLGRKAVNVVSSQIRLEQPGRLLTRLLICYMHVNKKRMTAVHCHPKSFLLCSLSPVLSLSLGIYSSEKISEGVFR